LNENITVSQQRLFTNSKRSSHTQKTATATQQSHHYPADTVENNESNTMNEHNTNKPREAAMAEVYWGMVCAEQTQFIISS